MAIKFLGVINAEDFRHDQFGLIVPSTTDDSARIGTRWLPAQQIAYGQTVDEINHMGRQSTAIGDTVIFLDNDNRALAQVIITEIHMVETERLTDDDLATLSTTRTAYMRRLKIRGKGWFLTFER